MQYSLNVIFISLLVRLQFFAASGTFQRALNSISIDSRVSGLILKKVSCGNFCRDFFRPKMKLKVDFSFREDLHKKVSLHPL